MEDRDAWDRFSAIYTPLLMQWVKRRGLADQDAADIVQDVFSVLVRRLPEFVYQPELSFRSWLRTVTHSRIVDRLRLKSNTESVQDDLEIVVDGTADDLVSDQEYQQAVIERAMRVMKSDFEPQTWQAFWKLVVEGQTAPQVAAESGMTTGAVYSAKVRVLQRLRSELTGLLD